MARGSTTPRGSVEAYMDVSPMAAWDQDKWDMYDAELDIAFHGRDVFMTPLVNWVAMPPGADTWYTGRELLGTHVNHNPIGLRQRYIEAMYVDFRGKKLTSNQRWANKVQVHEFDEINSRYSNGSPQWMIALMRQRLNASITETYEKIARDMIMEFAQFKFLGDGNAWSLGTYDFSSLTASTSYQVGLTFVQEVKLRLIERSKHWAQRYGSWDQVVPGYPNDTLIMTTPNVLFDLWESQEGDWVQELRAVDDGRIINGGQFRYKGATFVDNMWCTLWNAGVIQKQVGVTSPILWGDGSPDPDSGDMVDNVYLTGQSGSDATHYIQCSAFSTGDFNVGETISIHTSRTATWGITNGVDFLDGETYEAEVITVDATNNRLTVTKPITQQYDRSFTGTPNGGSEATLYAYVTKARHVHPIMVVAQRGMATFAARTKTRVHEPIDDADLPGITRVTWDAYGGKNLWNPYIVELLFVVASDTRSGRAKVALR